MKIGLNGKWLDAGQPVFMHDNRSFRYGDGVFETMRRSGKGIVLEEAHYERLFSSLSILQYEIPARFTQEQLTREISELCKKNGCSRLARVRLSVFHGNGGLYEANQGLQYLLEAGSLNTAMNKFNDTGLVTGVYTEVTKNCDPVSNLKSANFLCYSMAARYALRYQWNDALVLNQYGRVADATVANVFIVKDGKLRTPALAEGCVAGVMRDYLLNALPGLDIPCTEGRLSVRDLEEADELFLTNSVYGIRWVREFNNNRHYQHTVAVDIYERLVKTIFS